MELKRLSSRDEDGLILCLQYVLAYLKGQPKLGRWYPKDSPFDWEAFTDNDYAEASLDRKCTTRGCQFLGCELISWQCKKHTVVANSTTEAKYVAASSCCGQVLWIQNQLLDYGRKDVKVQAYATVPHHHPSFIHQNHNLKPVENVGTVHERGEIVWKRAATTTSSLEAEQDSSNIIRTQSTAIPNVPLPQGISSGVLDLETTKTTQAKEIASLEKRVKKLERKRKSKTPGMKRFQDLVRYASVISSMFLMVKKVFVAEQSEKVVEEVVTAANVEVSTASPTAAIITTVKLTLAQTLAELKSARPKTKGVVMQEPSETTTTTTTISFKGQGLKREGLRGEKEEVNAALITQWNDIQDKVEIDYELAQRLQAEEQKRLTIEKKKSKLFQQLLEIRGALCS
ncbi:hypothetical protein Tco_0793680 [Tanacetum coccineum]